MAKFVKKRTTRKEYTKARLLDHVQGLRLSGIITEDEATNLKARVEGKFNQLK